MVIFTCYDDFESMMTCIYDAWAARLGHSNIRLQTEPIGNLELFCQYRHIEPDKEKAKKVIHSIRKKISYQAYQSVYTASMSTHPDKLDIIYRFLILGFALGGRALTMLGNQAVASLFELQRKVTNEAHQFKEFIRFSRLDNEILFSIIEPACNVLTLVAPHFEDRMPSENWMITDKTRLLSIVHPKDRDYFLTPITAKELSYMENRKDASDPYVQLWKAFFHSTAVEARANYKCQRNFLPLWYRKNMPEFSDSLS